MGRLTRIDSSIDEVSQFTYDRTGQLTGAQNTFEKDEAYAYDANGNRTGTGITNGTANRLLADANYTYTYDAEGNRLTRTDKVSGDKEEYEWDHRNRLASVTFKNSAGTVVQKIGYTYDAFDRLVRRAVDKTSTFDYADAALEYFGYDGQDLLFDILDADGTDGNAPVLSKRYLQGPAVDQILTQENALLATNDPNRTLWLTTDHLGSVRDVLRNDGTIAAHYQYDSFGAPLDGLENITKFGYAGYERDTTTGYYRTQTRWYDPRSGKWISEDWSLGPDSNPYRYVHNGATNFVDANGRQEHEPLLPDEYFADGLGLRPGEQLEDPHSYGAGVGHVFWGYGKAIVGTRDAAIAAGTDPFGTVGNTASALWNFRQTASMVCEDFATKLSSLEGQGELVGDTLVGVFTGAAIKRLMSIGRLGTKLDDLAASKSPIPNPALSRLQAVLGRLVEKDLLPQYRAIDPKLKWGYTGSFKNGIVGNPNKPTFGKPIDLSSFDVDFWIESDVLYKKFGNNPRADVKFRETLSRTPGFEGLRPNKEGFSIKFKPSTCE